MSGNSIRATNLVGLMAYDGDAWEDPFRVTVENIRQFDGAEAPDDGWVMLYRDFEEGTPNFFRIVH